MGEAASNGNVLGRNNTENPLNQLFNNNQFQPIKFSASPTNFSQEHSKRQVYKF